MSNFGNRFKALRISKGYTQEQLICEFNNSYKYNFTKAAISQYENNRRLPEINVLIDFAKYFNVSTDYLLCMDNSSEIIMENENSYNFIQPLKNIEIEVLPKILKDTIDSSNLVTLDGKKASKRSIEIVIDSVYIGVELARKK